MYNNLFNKNVGVTEAVGVYTPNTQLQLDIFKLRSLGFNDYDINALQTLVLIGRGISVNKIMSYGVSYEDAQRIKYMYDISIGRVSIESTDDLVKHLRKMYGKHKRIGISDLMLSKINKVPRKAVVAGIKDDPFTIFNSKNYKVDERLYDVVDISNNRIFIETSRKPILKYKQEKKIDGILEITEVKSDGKIVVAIDKKYAKLCNRFIIVGSLRVPEFHHGLIEIICIEGTRVYVYAQTLGTRETVRYNGGTQRIYDYGFMPYEIQSKLINCASELYKAVCGVYAVTHPSNSDFNIMDIEEKEETIEDLIEE